MTVQIEAPVPKTRPGVGTAVAQSLDGRDGRRQVLTLAAVLGRNRQAQDAEPRASLVALAPELAALFPARGVRVDQLFPSEPQWPRRTSVAAIPRRQNPSPRPSRMMLLGARFWEGVSRTSIALGTMMAKDRPLSKTVRHGRGHRLRSATVRTSRSTPRRRHAATSFLRLATPTIWFIIFSG